MACRTHRAIVSISMPENPNAESPSTAITSRPAASQHVVPQRTQSSLNDTGGGPSGNNHMHHSGPHAKAQVASAMVEPEQRSCLHWAHGHCTTLAQNQQQHYSIKLNPMQVAWKAHQGMRWRQQWHCPGQHPWCPMCRHPGACAAPVCECAHGHVCQTVQVGTQACM